MFCSKIVAMLSSLSVMALFALPVSQGGVDSKDSKARDALDAWLAGIPGAEQGKVEPVADEVVRRVFPDDRFYALRFMRYPRAQRVARPLKLENLIHVALDGSVTPLEKDQSFQKMLEKKLRLDPAGNAAEAREILRACLRLAEAFFQDGYYHFAIAEDSLSVATQGDHLVATGKTVVSKGGRGDITLTLTFKSAGKIEASGILVVGKVRPDVRNL